MCMHARMHARTRTHTHTFLTSFCTSNCPPIPTPSSLQVGLSRRRNDSRVNSASANKINMGTYKNCSYWPSPRSLQKFWDPGFEGLGLPSALSTVRVLLKANNCLKLLSNLLRGLLEMIADLYKYKLAHPPCSWK